ncbi:MAG: T9SS type A sorting domain-containing protein [Chitinophagaceae bacterium]|nr:T9SS type A sorting domain-containing protein [Chitinophagaceae bacterium]
MDTGCAGNRRTPFQYKSRGFVIKINVVAATKNVVWFKQSNDNTLFTRIIEASTLPKKRYYVSGQDMQVARSNRRRCIADGGVARTTGTMTMLSNRKVLASETWNGVIYDPTLKEFYVGGRYNYNTTNTMMRQSITKLNASFAEVWSYPYVKNITTDQARLYLTDLLLSNSKLYAVGAGDLAGQGIALTQQFIATDLNGTLQAGQNYTINGNTGTLHQVIAIPGSTDLILLGDLYDAVNPSTYGNAYLMRVDASGNKIWANKYPFSLKSYSSSVQRISGMAIQGGSLYVVGQYLPSSNIPQAALLKVNTADGNGLLGCADSVGIAASPFTYQGPLTPMSPETYVYTDNIVKYKKHDIIFDWNTVCSASNPCGNDTTDLGDQFMCAGQIFNYCGQNFTIPGHYVVSCLGDDGCVHTSSFDLIVSSLAAHAGPDGFVYGCCANTLNGSATGGTPGYTYAWLPIAGLSSPGSANTNCSVATTYTLTVTDAAGCTSTDVVVMAVGNPTGSCCRVGGNAESTVKVFPNPSSNDFTIDAGGNEISKLMVLNMLGQLVETVNGFSTPIIFGKQLPEGIYNIIVEYADGKSSQIRVAKVASEK